MFFKLSLVALIALIGSVTSSLQGRIVNGVKSNIKYYNFMVSLSVGEGFCSGTILSTHLILTAAQCVDMVSPSDISFTYGTNKVSAASGLTVFYVKKIFIHDSYDNKTYDNNIALLEVVTPIAYNSETGPVKLPESLFEIPQHENSVPGVALGWGAKTDSGEMELNLQKVNLKIYSDEKCKSLKKNFTTEILCGGVDKGVKGICIGDIGGPLLSTDSVQLGIASTIERPCGSSPSTFIKVSHYRAWIDKHMQLF